MRILSVGYPLPGAPVDNHSFAGAPSFFDYDAVLVDVKALSSLIEDVVHARAEHTTRGGERLVNGVSGPDSVGLAALLRDRRDETARLLARGGLVVCLAYPNAVHEGVTGFSGCDRYCWLPAPPGLAWNEPFLRRGAGTGVLPVEHDHPFGPLVDRLRTYLAYQAYVAEDAPGVAGTCRVFARSTGGASIGVEFSVSNGRVVLLPPPARALDAERRYEFSNAVQSAVQRTLRLSAESSPPPWVQEYDLPGLSERVAARDEARQRLEQAQEALAQEDGRVEELERFRRLLWQQGTIGLEEPVRDALARLGFRVIARDIESPARLQIERDPERRVVLLEVESSDGAVGMDGHYRLRRRLEEAIAQGKPRRGLLVINGHRTREPSERPPQYEEPLRIAAESLGYCIATTTQLFHAVRAALGGDEQTIESFRERLLVTDGALQED